MKQLYHAVRFRYWFRRGIRACRKFDTRYEMGDFFPHLILEREKCKAKAHYHFSRCAKRRVDLQKWMETV